MTRSRARQFGEMIVAAQGRYQQHRLVAALLVDRVSALGDRKAGLANVLIRSTAAWVSCATSRR